MKTTSHEWYDFVSHTLGLQPSKSDSSISLSLSLRDLSIGSRDFFGKLVVVQW
jgi:hypothetical protein